MLLCGSPRRMTKLSVGCLSVGEASFSRVVNAFGALRGSWTLISLSVITIPLLPGPVFCHVRALSRIRLYLKRKAVNSEAVTLVSPELEYCNSLLRGLPSTQLNRFRSRQIRMFQNKRKKSHTANFEKKKKKTSTGCQLLTAFSTACTALITSGICSTRRN